MDFGSNVRRLRRELGMTQVELCDALGISQQYLSRIEGGEKPLSTLELAGRLATALGVTVDDLLRSSEEESPEPVVEHTQSA
jgi:transcriptional regulator with XRE-family HTH domain